MGKKIVEIKENKMGSAPLFKLIVSMSLPAIFSMLVQALYNIVDSIYVAQIGENALAAVSLAFPMQSLLIAVAVGTGVGLNSLISRRLGEQKIEEAGQAADHGILLGVISSVVFALIGIFGSRAFFSAFTDNAEVLQMGISYGTIVLVFSFGSFIQINCEKILQATGNMFWPMVFQLIGAVTNIILDPILIFGWFGFPAMGVSGAAIATVVGQIFAMGISVYVLLYKKHDIHISFKGFRPNWDIIKDIYKVGFPSIIMQSIGSVMMVGMNSILTGFSITAVTVMGIYTKLQSFVFMPIFGLTQGLMPIMGYNYGARNKKRLMGTVKIGIVMAFCIMLVGSLIFSLFPKQLLYMFKPTEELLQMGIPALRIFSTGFVFAAVSIVLSTLFQATGFGTASLLVSALRQLVIILPLAFIMSKTAAGLMGVWAAVPIAEVAAILISGVIFNSIYKNKIKYMENQLL